MSFHNIQSFQLLQPHFLHEPNIFKVPIACQLWSSSLCPHISFLQLDNNQRISISHITHTYVNLHSVSMSSTYSTHQP